MGKYATNVLVAGDPAEHPAACFWRILDPGGRNPESIVILKERLGPQPGKSSVYRLAKADPAGRNVIAKRCAGVTAAIERTIYEEVLPALPLSGLRYYGCVEESGDGIRWLFLEEAAGEMYQPEVRAHGAAAARWLARMHTAAAQVEAAAGLPERGATHYLEVLQGALRAIQERLNIAALGSEEAHLLAEIATRLDAVESHWPHLVRICSGFPSTLVHGDFVPKNVVMRPGPGGPVPLPFDWESAGWGVPAADLELLDLEAYSAAVGDRWSGVDRGALAALKHAGILFRCIASIEWVATRLQSSWVERPLRDLRFYLPGLRAVTRDLGWE